MTLYDLSALISNSQVLFSALPQTGIPDAPLRNVACIRMDSGIMIDVEWRPDERGYTVSAYNADYTHLIASKSATSIDGVMHSIYLLGTVLSQGIAATSEAASRTLVIDASFGSGSLALVV